MLQPQANSTQQQQHSLQRLFLNPQPRPHSANIEYWGSTEEQVQGIQMHEDSMTFDMRTCSISSDRSMHSLRNAHHVTLQSLQKILLHYCIAARVTDMAGLAEVKQPRGVMLPTSSQLHSSVMTTFSKSSSKRSGHRKLFPVQSMKVCSNVD